MCRIMNRKVGYVFPMVVVSMLPHADFGPNDDREDTLHFIISGQSGNGRQSDSRREGGAANFTFYVSDFLLLVELYIVELQFQSRLS